MWQDFGEPMVNLSRTVKIEGLPKGLVLEEVIAQEVDRSVRVLLCEDLEGDKEGSQRKL